MYLGSVVPIDMPQPLPYATAAQTALENTLAACAQHADCHAAFPELRNEVREMFAVLDSGGALAMVPGRLDPITIHRGRVAEWLRAKLNRAASAAEVPLMIHQAYLGNWQPIVDDILADARAYDAALSFGLFFSVTCSEDVVFVREQDIARETHGTFLGAYRVRQQQAACAAWTNTRLPSHYRDPVISSVPTLLVAGDSDSGTPLWHTAHAAKGLRNSIQVVLHGRGHTEWSDCVGELYQQLVRKGTVRELRPSACDAALPRPPFKTE